MPNSSPSSNALLNDDLQVERLANGWVIVRLNRPKSLNALDNSLVGHLVATFEGLLVDPTVRAIWLESSLPKALCAGGDVRTIRTHVLAQTPETAEQFFKTEYLLDQLLHDYPKPIVVWGEGYIMGGGMGLMMAAPFRLVTATSRLAMPEITIGLFPDVGGTRFLAQGGTVGLFMGLTGSQANAADSYAIAWATQISGLDRATVLDRLMEIDWQRSPAGPTDAVDDVLRGVHAAQEAGPLQQSLAIIREVCQGISFKHDYESICQLAALDPAAAPSNAWLKTAGENLAHGSPSTAHLTWLLWKWATEHRAWQDVFDVELNVAAFQIRSHDFSEGVRARLVDRDHAPKWQNFARDAWLQQLTQASADAPASWQRFLAQSPAVLFGDESA